MYKSDEVQLLKVNPYYLLSKSKEHYWKLGNLLKQKCGMYSENYKYPLLLLYFYAYLFIFIFMLIILTVSHCKKNFYIL